MTWKNLRTIAGALVLLAGAAAAEDEERIRRLEESNRALEERNRSLEERVDKLESGDAGLAREAARLADEEGLGLAIERRHGIVRATLQIFGDVNAFYQSPDAPDRANVTLVFGGVNLFATAQVGDHLHVLNETVIKTHESSGMDSIEFDQERLYALWAFSDLLYLKFGLEHGPASRWNRLYHHGRWLETTIDRPILARFESAGGILPLHNTALEAGGKIRAAFGVFDYVFLVANGRGRTVDDPQKFSDRNDAKAFEGGVGFMPEAVDGLRIGFDARWDEIPPNPTDPLRVRPIRQLLVSGSIEFRGDRIEILAEFAWIEDEDDTGGDTFAHTAAYLQIAYRLRARWTPYFRFDMREMDAGDPYYAPSARDLDRWQVLLGIRFDVLPNVAIKFEFGAGRQETRESGGVIDEEGYLRGGVQVSWVF